MTRFLFTLRKRVVLMACLLLCVDVLHAQTIQVGASGAPPATQSSTYNGIPSPVFSAKENARIQLFYTKAELNAAGMTGAQIIDSFAYYVFTLPAGPLQNYTITMKTASNSFADYNRTTGFSQVYTVASQIIDPGWNTFPLQTPFYWNGTDNIVIDFCWTNNTVAPNTGGVWADVGANHANINWYISDTVAACNNYPAQENYYNENRPVLQISYHAPAPCSAPASFTISPAGPVSITKGCSQKLEATGVGLESGLTYDWEISTNGGTTWNTVAVTPAYEFYPQVSAQYRLTISCGSSSATSNVVTVNVTAPPYAALPYFQDFENWINGCLGFKELPDAHWVNSPNIGSSSWRRDDQGQEAGWPEYIYYNFVMLNYGSYEPTSISGNHSARFHSRSLSPKLAEKQPGNLDLHIDCSSGGAGKALYFYYYDSTTNDMYKSLFAPFLFTTEDSLLVQLSTDGGSTFSTMATFTEATGPGWHRVHLPFTSTSATTVLRFHAARTGSSNSYFSDIGIDSVYVAPSCTGAPVAGTIANSQMMSCSATTKTLTAVGTSLSGGLNYQWQQSSDNITWTNTSGGSGAQTLSYTTVNLSDTTYYRLVVTCTGSGLSDTTNVVTISVPAPVYATLPYTEGFENWADYCETKDRPAPYWYNTPATGSFAWRRDDEGNTAGWGKGSAADAYNYNYSYTINQNYYSPTHTNPPAIEGEHFARNHAGFESFDALLWSFLGSGRFPNYGKMDLYVDCSGAGQKELSFFYSNQGTAAGAPIDDSLYVYLSTDGGNTFTTLLGITDTNTLWNYISIPFTSTAANTIIRFEALNDFDDGTMGIDRVQVASECAAQPTAGIVDSSVVNYACANDTFYVRLAGSSLSGGLTYEWQTSPNGTAWTSVANSNTPVLATSMNADTWYRCIVSCTSVSLADTTPARLIPLAPFYYCYCNSAADNSLNSQVNIGNVLITDTLMKDTILNNGVAFPYTMHPGPYNFYSDFNNVTATPLAQGSTYQLDLRFVAMDDGSISSSSGAPVATAFIDFDRNGVYDPTEQIFFSTMGTLKNMITSGTELTNFFTVPANASPGITGMRILVDPFSGATNAPCGYFATGETEDYLVLIDNPKCSSTPLPGIAYITDTLVQTVGATVIVYDTAHSKANSQIFWIWQSSYDGVTWTDVAGSEMKDSLTATITTLTYFRMMTVCKVTQDTVYSNPVHSLPLSISTLSAEEGSMSLYPNPTEGRIEILFEGKRQKQIDISVTDITGKLLIQRSFKNVPAGFRTEIDLSNYAKGLYLIKSDFEKGSLIHKIIVK